MSKSLLLIPKYLLEYPTWTNYEAPLPGTLEAPLPFEKLSPESFEIFCLNFFLKRVGIQGGAFRLEGTPGQFQGGYDIWGVWHNGSGPSDGQVFAECKRRKKIELRSIIDKFLEENRNRILQKTDEFWIFTSSNLQRQSKKIRELTNEFEDVIRLVVCDAHHLTVKLRTQGGVYSDLVAMTFGESWAHKLYNDDWMEITSRYARENDSVSAVLAGHGVYQTLRELYPGYPLLELCGRTMPVTVFDAAKDERENIESPLGELLFSRIPAGDEYDPEFEPSGLARFNELRTIEKEELCRHKANEKYEIRVWNGVTYAMERLLRQNDRWKFRTTMGRYFQAAATCDLLEKELIEAHNDAPEKPVSLQRLPRRKWLHEQLGSDDPVTMGVHRSAAIAISTLVVVYDPGYSGYKFLIHERSTKVQAHPFRYHVIPSMMFQPVVNEDKPCLEYSVRHNILREFLEELYDVAEVRSYQGHFSHDHFYEERPIVRLNTMLHSPDPERKAHLLYTGITINLMNLRPEICTVLIIKDPTWLSRESKGGSPNGRILRFSNEFLREEETSVPGSIRLDRQQIKMTMELDENLMPVKPHLLRPENLVPPAAAAIHLGLNVARHVLLK